MINQMNNQKLKQFKMGDVEASLETHVVKGLTAEVYNQKLIISIVVNDVNDDGKFLGADLSE